MVIRSYTLNQVVQRLRVIAEAHAQIETVFYGSVKRFFEKNTNVKYPALVFQISESPINQNKELFPVEMWYIDRLDLDRPDEHQLEVHSDSLSVTTDIVAKMKDENLFDWKVEPGINRDLFADDITGATNTVDFTAGVFMEVTLSTGLRLDRCAVPGKFNTRIFESQFEKEFE